MTTPVRRGTTNRNDRGSAEDRRNRRQWLLNNFGDGKTAPCAINGPGCTGPVDVLTLTVDRYPIAGVDGGTYQRGNIRPACPKCNSSRGGAIRRTAA